MKLNKSIDNKLGQTIPQGEPVKILIDEGEKIYIYPYTRNGAVRGAWVKRGDVIE